MAEEPAPVGGSQATIEDRPSTLRARRTAHVELISPVKDFSFDVGWYEFATQDHFWFKWRMIALLQMLWRNNIPTAQPLRVLEVGCGTGALRSQVEAVTNWTVDGTDLDLQALSRMKPGRGKVMYYDITDQDHAIADKYDVVILFDVLEHIADTKPFLQSLLGHLKPGGLLLINVPASEALRSSYDDLVGHVRRYDRKTLAAEFADLPLTIKDMRYWGFSMIPFLFLRKLVLRLFAGRPKAQRVKCGFNPPNPLVHKAFHAIMRTETTLTTAPVAGTSLMMIGQLR